MPRPRLHILAIEPDPKQREELRAQLSTRFPIDSVVAVAPEESHQAFSAAVPALVLLSALTPQDGVEHVMDELEQVDPDGIVPVLTVPPFVSDSSVAGARGSRSACARRPQAPIVRDPEAVMARIGETLAGLRDELSRPGSRSPKRFVRRSEIRVNRTPHDSNSSQALIRIPAVSTVSSFARTQLERASRLTAGELPQPFSLTTANGVVVRLLNLSTTGVLFESPLKFIPGTETSLHLVSPECTTALPSRFVRSEVSAVETRGVTYRTAVRFNKEIDVLGSIASRLERPAATMRAVADLLVRVTSTHSMHGDYAGARAAFEAGIRQILPACEVTLRDSLAKPPAGRESVFFSVPSPRGTVLQVTFRANHALSAEEFTLLKMASSAAAVILHFESAIPVRHARGQVA